MIELFKQLKDILVNDDVCIDNVIFRLYTRATVILLTACSAVLTLRTYFLSPINCFVKDSIIPTEVINSFCWVKGTSIVAEKIAGIVEIDNVGLGMKTPQNGSVLIEQQYYKWVCLVLGLQAIMFYAPRALWTVWERNIISFLAKDLATPLPQGIWTEEKRTHLTNYFTNSTMNSNNFYAIRFFVCEILNFLNSVSQIYFVDFLLNGQFSLLGPVYITYATVYNTNQIVDPLEQLFPLTGKCTMNTYGPSGTIQRHDAFCILTMNMINGKIYIILWFWLIGLSILGAITIIYRCIMYTQLWAKIYLLQAHTRFLTRQKIVNVVRNLKFGDFFLLYQLAGNVNPVVFKDLVLELDVAITKNTKGDA